ncbi:hypothetical protein Pint_11289 [Pistacia integerrima]|uniref:Uncharacterized protein n=1 Tax=Pistacia integerrima TaxID=434235 RepID=A0ACC0XLQ5_9ROSI|nr:hypothetical protein Pint_11289 [Pistacia integerrima]
MVKKSERHCDFYNNDGHTKETCFKLHGYPDWYKDLKEQKGKTQHKTYANMTDTPLKVEKELGTGLTQALSSIELLDSGSWIIDTGALSHMCNDLALFKTYNSIHKPTAVYLPDGSINFVQHIGKVVL